ncbi:hypothetical protein WMY93_022534 [Mugilogobius chulae]|uniref:Uncharacterized protein n=1 Tax=Mugilogobius chulae TaxID=88201 RepID=A0AAW0NHD5_9GOBI
MAEFYSSYKGMYVPTFCTPEALEYWEQFTFRPDDIIVATYKLGVDLVPLVLSGGDPSLVNSVPTWKRTPFIGETEYGLGMGLETQPSPRVMASHFHTTPCPNPSSRTNPR